MTQITEEAAARDADADRIPAELKVVLSRFASGVTVVAAYDGGRPVGMTASSFTALSLDPPLVLVCVARSALSFASFNRCDRFGISILSADQHALAARYATRGGSKFPAGETVDGQRTGAPLIVGALAHLECTMHEVLPGGDHAILVGRVLDSTYRGGRPLVNFARELGTFAPPREQAERT